MAVTFILRKSTKIQHWGVKSHQSYLLDLTINSSGQKSDYKRKESSHQNKHHCTPKLRRRRRRRRGTSRQSPSRPIRPSLVSMTSSICGDDNLQRDSRSERSGLQRIHWSSQLPQPQQEWMWLDTRFHHDHETFLSNWDATCFWGTFAFFLYVKSCTLYIIADHFSKHTIGF